MDNDLIIYFFTLLGPTLIALILIILLLLELYWEMKNEKNEVKK